ncbi:esterase/lipase family protein [Nocardia gipuzkoensis]
MVNERRQDTFSKFSFDDSRTNLHRHHRNAASSVVIFVHGLNGDGYKTWQGFPKFLFEGVEEQIDVALFDYYSGIQRRLKPARPTPEDIAETFAQRIVTLGRRYDEVYIVAHSLGGLIAKAAAKLYLENHASQQGKIASLSGILHFGTPLRGSKLAGPWAKYLLSERRNLRMNAYYQDEIAKFFDENIDTYNSADPSKYKYRLPVFGAYGEFDTTVEKASAVDGVHPAQRQGFDGDHKSIVKPQQKRAPQVTWVRGVIRDIASCRAELRAIANESKPGRAANSQTSFEKLLVTELSTDLAGGDWLLPYQEVVKAASTNIIMVRDVRQVASVSKPHLLFSIHANECILTGQTDTKAAIFKAVGRYNAGGMDVYIIGVGLDMTAARSAVAAWVDICGKKDSQHRLLLDMLPDVNELQIKLADYIGLQVTSREDSLTTQISEPEESDNFSSINIRRRTAEEE